MMGTPYTEFTNFMNMTPALYMTSADEIINEATHRMPVLGRLMTNRSAHELIQGGKKIQDIIHLSVTVTGGTFSPQAPASYQNTQSGTLHDEEWRFYREHMMWNEEEIGLNVPEGLSATSRVAYYKSLKFKKEQELWTKILKGLDDQLLAEAHGATAYAAMEGATGEDWMSIHAIVNEETNGLCNGWTTVNGVAPATDDGWVPTQYTYDYDEPDDDDMDGDGLFDRFSDAHENMQWEIPDGLPGAQKYFQRSGQDPARRFWMCSAGGMTFYRRRLMERNDATASMNDPHVKGPAYAGVPVIQVSQLSAVTWYDADGSFGSTTTELAANSDGYRYFGIDGNFLKPFFHVSNFFNVKPSFVLQGQPDSSVQLVVVWGNLFAQSRARHACISPQ
jgi:hypothetical protein